MKKIILTIVITLAVVLIGIFLYGHHLLVQDIKQNPNVVSIANRVHDEALGIAQLRQQGSKAKDLIKLIKYFYRKNTSKADPQKKIAEGKAYRVRRELIEDLYQLARFNADDFASRVRNECFEPGNKWLAITSIEDTRPPLSMYEKE